MLKGVFILYSNKEVMSDHNIHSYSYYICPFVAFETTLAKNWRILALIYRYHFMPFWSRSTKPFFNQI